MPHDEHNPISSFQLDDRCGRRTIIAGLLVTVLTCIPQLRPGPDGEVAKYLAGPIWVNRHQLDVIEYLQEENRVLMSA
jgi:hypothetical protein